MKVENSAKMFTYFVQSRCRLLVNIETKSKVYAFVYENYI